MFLLTIFLQIIYFRRPLLTDISGHYSLQIFLQVYSNIFQDTIICHLSTDIFTFFSPRHQYLQILSYIFDGNHCFRDISKDIFYVFSTPLPFHYGYFYRYFLILFIITIRYWHRYLPKQTSDYVRSYCNWYFSLIFLTHHKTLLILSSLFEKFDA